MTCPNDILNISFYKLEHYNCASIFSEPDLKNFYLFVSWHHARQRMRQVRKLFGQCRMNKAYLRMSGDMSTIITFDILPLQKCGRNDQLVIAINPFTGSIQCSVETLRTFFDKSGPGLLRKLEQSIETTLNEQWNPLNVVLDVSEVEAALDNIRIKLWMQRYILAINGFNGVLVRDPRTIPFEPDVLRPNKEKLVFTLVQDPNRYLVRLF